MNQPSTTETPAVSPTYRELEALYLQKTELTLGKTRKALEKMAALVAASPQQAPQLAAIEAALAELGLESLPFHTVLTLLDTVRPERGGQVLSTFTLKDLEQTLSRSNQPRLVRDR